MRRYLKEAASLNLAELYLKITEYLRNEYDLTSDVSPTDCGVRVSINGYQLYDTEKELDEIGKKVYNLWNRNAMPCLKAVEVCNAEFGYFLKLDKELIETVYTEDDNLFLTESRMNEQDVDNGSNIVLDNKYIWFFNVLDGDGNILEENIKELETAISSLVKNGGSELIAVPYVDPAPDNEDVELVQADNIGLVTLYKGGN